MRLSMLLALVVTFSLYATPVPGEPSAEQRDLKPEYSRSYPLGKTVIDDLIKKLRANDLAAVPRTFFGDGFDKNLVDLMMFFETKDLVRINLVKNDTMHEDLWGDQDVWVMVFTTDPVLIQSELDSVLSVEYKEVTTKPATPPGTRAQKVITNTAKTTETRETVEVPATRGSPASTRTTESTETSEKTDTTETSGPTGTEGTTTTITKVKKLSEAYPTVRVEALEYRRGIGEVAVIAGIAKLFGVTATGDDKRLEDRSERLHMAEVGSATNGECLYYGVVKIPLRENTIYRVRTAMNRSRGYSTFSNYSRSRISASVGLAFTIVDGKHSVDGVSPYDVEPYILFHGYPWRRRLPRDDRTRNWHRGWPSAVVGFKISEDAFSNVIVGASLNNIVKSAGVFLGFRYSKPTGGDWSWSYALGINYDL